MEKTRKMYVTAEEAAEILGVSTGYAYALVLRELYGKSKTAPTEEEREKARQEYLDRRGIPDSFRW